MTPSRTGRRCLFPAALSVALLVLLALSRPCLAQPAAGYDSGPHFEPAPAGDWRHGYTLVLLDTPDPAAARRARSAVERAGGRIGLSLSAQAMLGWVPAAVAEGLVGRDGIVAIYHQPVSPDQLPVRDAETLRAAAYFNSVVSGEYRPDAPAGAGALPLWRDEVSSALFVDGDAYRRDLRRAGLAVDPPADGVIVRQGPDVSAAGLADRMTGECIVSAFFVESDGSIDADQYDWSTSLENDALNDLSAALSWFASEAAARGEYLHFQLVSYPATDARCRQGYEPITHGPDFASTWVGLVMTNFGYPSGVTAYNTWARSTYGTQRAFSAFFARGTTWPNGIVGIAYGNGPHWACVYAASGRAGVFAHETAHLFNAADEYAGGSACTNDSYCTTLYRNGAANGNCAHCGTGVPCVMKDGTLNMCSYTAAHIGWGLVSHLDCGAAIEAQPGTYSGNTTGGPSNVRQYSECAPTTDLSGPERLYRFALPGPGTVTVTLSSAVDLRISLLTSCSENACVGRASAGSRIVYKEAPAGTYYVTVDGYAAAAGAYTITIRTALAPTVTLTSPLDGSVVPAGSVAFAWQGAASVTSYRIQIDHSTSFASSALISATVSTRAYTTTLAPGTWYWRVRSLPDGAWAAPWHLHAGSTILGDVNGDGLVDSTDSLIILTADSGLDTSQFCPMNCGDANGDGFVDSTDALIILTYDTGLPVGSFPVGQPGCPSNITQPSGCSP